MYYIALENIRSLFNIGAIFRTCSFFGITNVILVGYSGIDLNGKLHPKISKSSLGSEKELSITILKDAEELIKFANENQLQIAVIEQTSNSVGLATWEPTINTVLVFGNEVDGVSNMLCTAANVCVEIKGNGKHNSLNVTTSVGIVLNHLAVSQKQ